MTRRSYGRPRVARPGPTRPPTRLDGRRDHGTPEQHDADHQRQNALTDLGYPVLRFTPRQIAQEPDAVITLIRRAIARLATR
jgi:very-short-patch-repair endonuclease